MGLNTQFREVKKYRAGERFISGLSRLGICACRALQARKLQEIIFYED